MRFDRGLMLSVAAHGLFLVWALVTFARPFESKPIEAISADVISADDFSKMMAGSSQKPKAEAPKPVVEKIAEEEKPTEDVTAKVAEKEVKAATDETKPEPAPKKPDPKPAAAPPEPKQEEKAADKKEPEQKIDPIAEALKKDDAKKPEKKVENKPQPVKKPEPQQPKFDPRKVAMLLDKREAQRTAATGTTMNSMASAGTPKGTDQTVSQSAFSALAACIRENWDNPAGMTQTIRIKILTTLKRDAMLDRPPQVTMPGSGGIYQAMRESAERAILKCQPFNMLLPYPYEGWREFELNFVSTDFR